MPSHDDPVPQAASFERLASWLLAAILAAAPLVVLPRQVDFAALPQQAFVQTAALALALLWLLWRPKAARLEGWRPLDLPVATFLAWSAVSLLAAPERQPGGRILLHWAACALVYLLASRTARLVDVPRLAAGALIGATLVAVLGLAQAVFGLSAIPQAIGPAGTMANRNLAAGYLASVAPLALVLWDRPSSRRLAIAALAPILAFLPFTLSRAAAVALALQAVILATRGARSEPRRARARARLLAGSLVAAVALAFAFGLSARDAAKAGSVGIRRSLAASALRMAEERPLLGVGLGRFGALYRGYGPVVRNASGPLRVESPHDEPLQVLAETGLPGLLAFAWIGFVAFRLLLRLRRSESPAVRRVALGLGASLAGLAVDATLGFPLRGAVPPLLAAVILGVLARLDHAPAPATAQVPAAGKSRLGRWRVPAAALACGMALVASVAFSSRRLAADRALLELRVAELERRWGDAVAAGRRAVAADPEPTVLRALARAELRLGHSGAAVRLLGRLLEAEPFDAVGLATLGVARWAEGDGLGAAAALRLARTLDVGQPRPGPGAPPLEPSSAPAMPPCAAGVSVEISGGDRVSVSARAVPLDDVLRCLSRTTGVRLEFDGTQPRQPVTVALQDQPLASALESLFEGLGLNYVLSARGDGRVERLIILGASSPRPSATTTPRRTAPQPTTAPPPGLPEDELGGGEEPAPAFEPEQQPPGSPHGSGAATPMPYPVPYPTGPGPAGRGAPTSPPSPVSPQPGSPGPGYSPSSAQPNETQPGFSAPEFPDPAGLSPTVRQFEAGGAVGS